MVRRTALLLALAGLAAACDTNPTMHRDALAPEAPAKVDLALEPLSIEPCTETVLSAHPGEGVSLCARVTMLVKHGKGKNAKLSKTAKKGEAVVFHMPVTGNLLGDPPDLMATTDAAGEARVVYTAGSATGQQTLLATTTSGAQVEIDVMVSEPVPLATVGQPHPDTAYPTSRDFLGDLSHKVFGKSVTGVR